MKTITLKLDEITLYKNNPRKNDGAVEAVMESIKQCGYIAPIIVDENYEILAGHTRYKALKKLGWSEVECVIKEGLTEEQKKKYRILDNKTNELAEWDFELLEQEIEGLDFSGIELDWGLSEEKEEVEVVEDDFDVEKELENTTTINTQLGDIYILGEHRLMYGDSTSIEDVNKLMNGGV